MTTRSEGRVPETLPERPCEERDFIRDYVGDAEMYRGHNGSCDNCGAEFSEADEGDLSTAHWMHRKAVAEAFWAANTPERIKVMAKIMDPDDPMDATEHAERYAAHIDETPMA